MVAKTPRSGALPARHAPQLPVRRAARAGTPCCIRIRPRACREPGGAPGRADATAVVWPQHFDVHDVARLEQLARVGDIAVVQLADVHERFDVRRHVQQHPDLQHLLHLRAPAGRAARPRALPAASVWLWGVRGAFGGTRHSARAESARSQRARGRAGRALDDVAGLRELNAAVGVQDRLARQPELAGVRLLRAVAPGIAPFFRLRARDAAPALRAPAAHAPTLGSRRRAHKAAERQASQFYRVLEFLCPAHGPCCI